MLQKVTSQGFVLVASVFISTLCKEICISISGTDVTGCGNPNSCCLTISYAVEMAEHEDILILHSKLPNKTRYEIPHSIYLNKSLHFKASTRISFKPIISFTANATKRTYLFTIKSSKHSISLSFQSIDFEDSDILLCSKSNCRVNLVNVTISFLCHESVASFKFLGNDTKTPSTNTKSELYVENSKFISKTYMLYSSGQINATLSNTTLLGCFMFFKNKYPNIESSISIFNLHFAHSENKYVLKTYGVFNVTLQNCKVMHVHLKENLVHIQGRTVNNLRSSVTISKLMITNASLTAGSFIKLDHSSYTILGIDATNMRGRAIVELYRTSGYISYINASSNILWFCIASEYGDMRVKNINLTSNTFEKVYYYERFSPYSPYSKKSIIFGEEIKMSLTSIYLKNNSINLHGFFCANSEVNAQYFFIETSNIVVHIFHFEYTKVTFKNVRIHKNSIGQRMFYLVESEANITDISTEDNKNFSVSHYYNVFEAQRSRLELINSSIIGNKNAENIFLIEINSSANITKSHLVENTIKEKIFNGNKANIFLDTIDVYQTRDSIDIYKSLNSLRLLFYFADCEEQYAVILKNIQFINNDVSKNLVHSINSNITILNFNIINNTAALYAIYGESSTAVFNNVLIKGNTYTSGVYFTECDVFISEVEGYGNTALGMQKFFYFGAHKPKSDNIQFYNVMIRNIYTEDSQSMIEDNSRPVISLGVIMAFLKMDNITIVLQGFQWTGLEMSFDSHNSVWNIKPETNIHCPFGAVPKTMSFNQGARSLYQIFCKPCELGKYTILRGLIQMKGTVKERDIFRGRRYVVKRMNITKQVLPVCKNCTTGGECRHGNIISRGNYYGYRTKNYDVEYIPCPAQYCCSSKGRPCTSYSTCNWHRQGTLCGHCQDGYFESFFQQGCLKKGTCTQQITFWIFYFGSGVVLMLVLCFVDDVKNLIVNIGVKLCRNVHHRKNNNKSIYVIQPSSVELNNDLSGNVTSAGSSKLSENSSEKPHNARMNLRHKEKHSSQQSYTTMAILNAFLSYYQIKSLINIDIGNIFRSEPSFAMKVTSIPAKIFNFQLFLINIDSTFCPMENLNPVSKSFMKDCLVTVVMLCVTFIFISLLPTKKRTTNISMSLSQKLEIGYLRILIFGYKNIGNFALVVVNCVQINDMYVLYVNGTQKCFVWWQYVAMVFNALWVLPFPWCLYGSYVKYRDCKISCRQMLVSLTFPPYLLFIYAKECSPKKIFITHHPLQLNRIREMFEEPYRLKPQKNAKHVVSNKCVFWEHWRLILRLVLSIITTMVVNPLQRVSFVCPVILIFMIIYFKVRPFKEEMKLLHWMEVISLFGFCYLLVYNVLKAYIYVYNITNMDERIGLLVTFFDSSHILLSPIFVLVMYLLVNPIFGRLSVRVQNRRIQTTGC